MTTPSISEGDAVTIKGLIETDGYDLGSVVIKLPTVTVTSTGNKVLTENLIRSDETYDTLQGLEAMPVKIQGKYTI